MRKRFWKRQWIAVVMASSMVVSTANVPAGHGTFVQAAENESGNVFYSSTEEVQTNGLELPEEDWTNYKQTITYDNSITDINITKNFTMTADIYLDEAGYTSLAEEGDYLKIQGVVKLGDEWEWNDSKDIPELKQNGFEETGQGYKGAVTIEFKDKTPDALKEIDFVIVGKGFAGKVTFANVTLTEKREQQITETKDPLVVDNFEEDETGGDAGWKSETGWQYDKTVTAAVENANGSNMLKLGLDYTGCDGYSWSEAKVTKNFEDGIDISAYNLLTFEVVYPEAFDGFKAKIFVPSQESEDGIINKDVIPEVAGSENGMKKALVTIPFSPSEEMVKSITLGIVGVNTSFKGDIYIDNIVLSQYDAASDFIDITSVPGTGTEADTSKMPGGVSLADKDAVNSAKALYSYLFSLEEAGQVLFGHQNDTHKHVTSRDGVYSDTEDITGSISGITGIDSLALTGVELGMTDVDAAIEECIRIGKEAASGGAILTLSLHMPNMGSEKIIATPDAGRKYDFSQCDFSESKDLSNNCSQEIMPGGRYNEQFTTYLDIIADYAKGLDGIPVLFRPFHENNGGWFWWGSSATNQETYKAIYRYMADYLKAAGVHNFIYVYSPNGPIESESEFYERYPGDGYVDIFAFDYYDDMEASSTYGDTFFNGLRSSCEIVKRLADSKGKIAAIAETGVRVTRDGSSEGIMVKDNPIKDKNWYSNVNKIAKETGMPYFLLWANFSDTNFYIPYKYNDTKGQELINEFIDFYNEDSSIFANGTNFYNNADQREVENKDQKIKSGYFTNLFQMGVVKDTITLKAAVNNALNVKFVLNSGSAKKELNAVKANSGYYEAELSREDLDALGKTDTGTASIVADGENIVTLPNISFGKDKPVLAKEQVDDFETYAGDTGLLSSKWITNKDTGCTVNVSLAEEPRYEGEYALKFDYSETKSGWAGAVISKEADWSEYNALRFFVKPDGKNQTTVVQINSGGTAYEAYLDLYDEYKNSKTPLLVTLPFSEFKSKNEAKIPLAGEALSNINSFGLWVNAIGDSDAFANGETTVTGTLYYDDIRAVSVNTDGPVFEETGDKPVVNPAVTPEPTKKPVLAYPSYVTTQQPQDSATQAPAETQTPDTTAAPEVTREPGTTQSPSETQAPVQTPGTTTDVVTDDVTGAVTETVSTTNGNTTTVTEKVTMPDGIQNIKETVTETLDGIITIKETLSSSEVNSILVKNITKYIDGGVISTDAVLYTGRSEINSNYSAKNVIPVSFLTDAKNAGINNVMLCIGKTTVDAVKANQGRKMVIKVEVPQVEGISVGKVILAEESIASATDSDRKLVVKMVNENASGSYTITIPQSELEKMAGDIDISVKAGNISGMDGNSQKKVEDILSDNGLNTENSYVVSIAENNTKGGIKVSAPVFLNTVKIGGSVYVYCYNNKTGKLEETANSKRTVLSDGMAGIEGYSGNDYIVTDKELTGKNVVTLLSKAKVSFGKTSVKKGGKIKISTVLPSVLELKTGLKQAVPYGKQAAVIKYKSSDTKVAKVSKDGTVKASGKGKAKITVQIKLADGKVKTVKKTITVK